RFSLKQQRILAHDPVNTFGIDRRRVVMWDGWFRHQDMAEGYLVMKSLDQEI
ncbi:TPA: hypothetical protein RQM61_005184, partial [Escherichia coli]|nr:hypothetical protein [Escherichia coli]